MKFVSILFGVLFCLSCAVQEKIEKQNSDPLNAYSFSEIDALMAENKRPIAVFLHAEWCNYCKNMEQTTLQDAAIIQLLNSHYYFVSFDGEYSGEINFNNTTFNYQPSGRTSGTHELAFAIGAIDGNLTYPNFVLINPSYEIIFQYNSFLNHKELRKVLEEGLFSEK